MSLKPLAKQMLLGCLGALAVQAHAATAVPTSPRVISPVKPGNPLTPIGPLAPVSAPLTTLQLVSKSTTVQTSVPVTFGHVFAPGVFPASSGLMGQMGQVLLPLQVNIKARHPDGSVRHAVISAVLPQLGANASAPLALVVTAAPAPAPAATPGALLASGFDATVNVTIAGQVYSASASKLLQSGKYTSWLAGPAANEWLVAAPLKTAAGVEHPHLAARFAIRAYSANGKVRADVTVENNWAYEADPKNQTYDAEVLVNGQRVYNVAALNHLHHARWRKLFWTGAQPLVDVKYNSRDLIASRAVPNYDQSVVVAPAALAAAKTSWDAGKTGPMGLAMLNAYMPTTGGRPDIGLLHAWAAMYVLSMDERAKEITLGLSDLGGSWGIHYRDRNTGNPVSIIDYPYSRTFRVSSDSYNPVTKKYEDMPVCTAAGQCATPYTPDSAHQASMSYLPYLITGDAYHLDELQFWANWNVISKNPGYRSYAKGIISGDQVRGQAWSIRTLAQTAYITPDDHPMKAYFNQILDNNFNYYNSTFAAGTTNQLGFIDHRATSTAVAYAGPDGPGTAASPWMDDFFTSAVGYALELGFTKAKPILDWKARFPVGRMMAPGYCWVDGAVYALSVRPSATAPYFNTFAEAYKATMRAGNGTPLVNSTGKFYLDQPCGSQAQADWRSQVDKDSKVWRAPWIAGEMTGYATSPAGYPSNMQPALAAAATTGIPNAAAAWTRFINRPVKPNYATSPQFAIVPR